MASSSRIKTGREKPPHHSEHVLLFIPRQTCVFFSRPPFLAKRAHVCFLIKGKIEKPGNPKSMEMKTKIPQKRCPAPSPEKK
jgi:hypothetical protein